MKIDFSIMLVAILCGCTSFHKDQHVNPFSKLEPSDVSKISALPGLWGEIGVTWA
jgi:hypothetical protein